MSSQPKTPDPSLRAKLRVQKLGGSSYMTKLAKRKAAGLTAAEHKAHSLMMVKARAAKRKARLLKEGKA